MHDVISGKIISTKLLLFFRKIKLFIQDIFVGKGWYWLEYLQISCFNCKLRNHNLHVKDTLYYNSCACTLTKSTNFTEETPVSSSKWFTNRWIFASVLKSPLSPPISLSPGIWILCGESSPLVWQFMEKQRQAQTMRWINHFQEGAAGYSRPSQRDEPSLTTASETGLSTTCDSLSM